LLVSLVCRVHIAIYKVTWLVYLVFVLVGGRGEGLV